MEGGDWSLHLSEGEYEQLEGLPSEFVLGASRFVPYKRLDWVIDAGSAVGTPVVLAGSGPEQRRLEYRAASAKVPVLFVVNPSDAMLYTLYQRSIAFIFPAIEDFGIMPVEAVAAGGKVIVWNVGGAAETVEELMGGVVLESKSCEGWRRAVDALSRIDTEAARKRVTRFDSKRFRNEVSEFVGVDCRNEDV
jgi:glycosyltransferase involved in cell wall biosynthesis